MRPLPTSFYDRTDVVQIARELIGKRLTSRIDNQEVSGLITETEAYAGETDRASHAFGGRRTLRTETMYAQPGTAYVYLCYGIHSMLNVVTNSVDVPHAVLVRGVRIDRGLEVAIRRRNVKNQQILSNGPGKVAQAFAISHQLHNGLMLTNGPIIIHDGVEVPENQIQIGPRIGVDYAGPDALLPYRFVWNPTFTASLAHV